MTDTYGPVNHHVVGHIMKKCVQNAMATIDALRVSAEVRLKEHPEGKVDYVTGADLAAQKEYLRILRDSFPTFGIIAEEDGLRVPCTDQARRFHFTVDPLDGTKAFVRKQSHGIGTMLALVSGPEVAAAYVGDVMTGEMYGYRPGAEHVYRIGSFGQFEALAIDAGRRLATQNVMLRDHPMAYSSMVRSLIGLSSDRPRNRFGGLEIESGSIGLNFARLWKGEVGAIILKPTLFAPWDFCPVFGISRKLGFEFLPILKVGDAVFQLGEDTLVASLETLTFDCEIAVVHRSRHDEMRQLFLGS